MNVHDENPFIDPPEERDPARQLRGRLVAPVTVLTAGVPGAPAGLTVSSLMIAEGEPPRVYFLVGAESDFYGAMADTGRFVMHVLSEAARPVGDVFAGLRPSPGGMFAGLEVADGPYGPELVKFETRARCRFVGSDPTPQHLLAHGEVDEIEVSDLADPLAYFRGDYRGLS